MFNKFKIFPLKYIQKYFFIGAARPVCVFLQVTTVLSSDRLSSPSSTSLFTFLFYNFPVINYIRPSTNSPFFQFPLFLIKPQLWLLGPFFLNLLSLFYSPFCLLTKKCRWYACVRRKPFRVDLSGIWILLNCVIIIVNFELCDYNSRFNIPNWQINKMCEYQT